MKNLATKRLKGVPVPYPLSRNEHAAIARYLTDITKQLHDIASLFTARYGQDSSVADLALKTLASSTLLENELMLLENEPEPVEELPRVEP